MSKKLSFSIAVNLLTENFKKGTNTVKNSLRSMQMQVLTFAAALGAGGLGISGLISRFRDVARETSRVLTALKNVSSGTAGFTSNLKFVNDLAKKYGLEINALVGNFAKFTASATQANMPMIEQKKVFESVSRAITAFGLSASESDGVMLALSQMMSKGKISMEELRKQMGEKLPVAIQAMAKALGVSIGQMEKLIGSGKVMSADVLPKFADALNEIIPNVDTDNLETSLSRLSNVFGNIVDASGFQNKYKALIDGLTSILQSASENIQNIVVGIVAAIAFVVTSASTKTLKSWWSMADGMTTKDKELKAALLKAELESTAAKKALDNARLNHYVATGKKKEALAADVAKKEILYARSVVAEDKARSAYTQIASAQTASTWKRSLNMIRLGAAKVWITIKSLWSTFAPAILLSAFAALTTYMVNAYNASKRLENTTKDYNGEVEKERININILFNKLRDATEGTDKYNKAKNEILSKYGAYLKGLSDEITSLKDVEGAYRAISRAALQAAKDKAIERGTTEATDDYLKIYKRNASSLQKKLKSAYGEEKASKVFDSIVEQLSSKGDVDSETKDIIDSFSKSYVTAYGTAGNAGVVTENKVAFAVDEIKRAKGRLDNEIKEITSLFGTLSTVNSDDVTGGGGGGTSDSSITDKSQEQREKRVREQKRAEEDLQLQLAQSRISSMNDGAEKVLAQLELNHKKEILELDRQTEDYLQKIIDDERAIFNANKNNKGKTFDSSGIVLSDKQKQGFNLIKIEILKKQSKELEEEYDKQLSIAQTYAQKRITVIKDYENKRKGLEALGASPDNLKQLDRAQTEELKAIDKEFAMHEDAFEGWMNSLSDMTISQLVKALQEAERALFLATDPFKSATDQKNNTEYIAKLRAQIDALKSQIKDVDSKTERSKTKRSVKEWKDLGDSLSKVNDELKEIGSNIGGSAGEMISFAGQVTTSTLGMINSMATLADWSVKSTEMAAKGMSKAIIAVEKASVILAIVSAVIQVLRLLDDLMPDAHDKYLKFDEKIERINDLRDAVTDYEIAVLKAKQAEDNWFGEDQLKSLKDAKKLQEEISKAKDAKNAEAQATYQNKKGGGWLTGSLNYGLLGGIDKVFGTNILGNKYKEGTTAAKDNLRIETRKRKSGFLGSGIGSKSQKTANLVDWAKENGFGDLFDADGWINVEAASVILEKYGNKLVGQTKETLEEMKALKEQHDEYIKQLRDYVSNMYEPLVDNMVSALWDWLDDGKDVLDSFKGYASQTFRQIANDMLKTLVMEKVVGSFKDDIADLYENYSTGKITLEELTKSVADRTAQMNADYEKNLPALEGTLTSIVDTLLNTTGIDIRDNEKTSQSGSKGYSVSMDQDTGDKLLGRATAMQMSGLKMEGLLSAISLDTTNIFKQTTSMSSELTKQTNILNNIYQVQTKSFFEVEGTGKNLKDMNSKLSNIEKYTKALE